MEIFFNVTNLNLVYFVYLKKIYICTLPYFLNSLLFVLFLCCHQGLYFWMETVPRPADTQNTQLGAGSEDDTLGERSIFSVNQFFTDSCSAYSKCKTKKIQIFTFFVCLKCIYKNSAVFQTLFLRLRLRQLQTIFWQIFEYSKMTAIY